MARSASDPFGFFTRASVDSSFQTSKTLGSLTIASTARTPQPRHRYRRQHRPSGDYKTSNNCLSLRIDQILYFLYETTWPTSCRTQQLSTSNTLGASITLRSKSRATAAHTQDLETNPTARNSSDHAPVSSLLTTQ